MKKVLFSLIFMVSLLRVYSLTVSGFTINTTNPLDCNPISFTVSGNTNCTNYSFNSISYTVTGTTITIDVLYNGGMICQGLGSSFSHTDTLSSISPGTYTVIVQGVLTQAGLQSTYQGGTMTVQTCCTSNVSFNSNSNDFCPTDTIKAINNSLNVQNYFWYLDNNLVSTSTNFDTTITTPGRYLLKLKGVSNCLVDSVQQYVTVNNDLNLGPDTADCLGGSITLEAPNGWSSYRWSTNSAQRSITTNKSGDYWVDVTAGTGCTQRDTIAVSFVGPEFNLGPDTFLCSGETIEIAVDTIWSKVVWDNGDSSFTRIIDSAGIYVAYVTNYLGCIYSDGISVVERNASVNITGLDTVCEGDTIVLSAGTNWMNVEWSNGEKTTSIDVNSAGLYAVEVIDGYGCSANDSVFVSFFNLPSVNLGFDTTICEGDSLELSPDLTGMGSWTWNDNSTDSSIVVSDSGQYYISVEDTNQCMASDSVLIGVLDCDTIEVGTGLSEFQMIGVSIYPNPAKSEVHVDIPSFTQALSYTIVSMNGQVKQSGILSKKTNFLDVSHLEPGYYVIRIAIDNSLIQKALIIQK
jgi:hypothetical protein